MVNFKDRLLDEKAQLDVRMVKLQEFQRSEGFKAIDPVQMSLLNVQANAMATYSQCLAERISWIEGKEIAAKVMAGDY